MKNGIGMEESNGKLKLLAVLAHPDDESFGMGGTLALYARRGVEVHLVCATRGEVGEVTPDMMKGYSTVAELRESELRCAAGVLGLAGVHFLGYRDSGMPGSPDNHHPKALAAAPLDEVAAAVTGYIRKIQPQVVLTFDPIGGYRHPDHIAIQQATAKAFMAAGDAEMYPDGLPAFQPQKLYFNTISRQFLRFTVRVLRLLRKDPHKWGKNGDIDLVSLAEVEFPTHAEVDFTSVAELRAAAGECHASQGGKNMARGFQGWIMNRFRSKETYMRAYPPPVDGQIERDLFAGVTHSNGRPNLVVTKLSE
ncbi:MAG TPA: PIG-L deacetylase family protein [Anaerolineaceae bacterium]|nr:PIG-L deacetylase family protein [Anaerolineaceae bacterium]